MSEIVVGRVSSILRYPVKSMLGEELESVAFDQRGVVGDRQYALIDDETGKVVSVKRPRWWGRMFELAGRTSLQIGPVQPRVSFTVPRCVMTTLAQGDLPADREVLRTIAATNSVDVLQTGTLYPCAGVYADVLAEGEIRRGDAVRIIG